MCIGDDMEIAHSQLQMGKSYMSSVESTGRIEIPISNSQRQEALLSFSRSQWGEVPTKLIPAPGGTQSRVR